MSIDQPAWMVLPLLGALACAEDLTLNEQGIEQMLPVVTETIGEGTYRTTVDARNDDAWVYFAFASGQQVLPDDPLRSDEWDLGFRRSFIIANGGESGPGSVAVLPLAGTTFDGLSSAPLEGYEQDRPDSLDDDPVADSAFLSGDGWYAYDAESHTLTARDVVYVVRTGAGAHYKLRLLGYYGAAGTSALPSFDWARLPLESG